MPALCADGALKKVKPAHGVVGRSLLGISPQPLCPARPGFVWARTFTTEKHLLFALMGEKLNASRCQVQWRSVSIIPSALVAVHADHLQINSGGGDGPFGSGFCDGLATSAVYSLKTKSSPGLPERLALTSHGLFFATVMKR